MDTSHETRSVQLGPVARAERQDDKTVSLNNDTPGDCTMVEANSLSGEDEALLCKTREAHFLTRSQVKTLAE